MLSGGALSKAMWVRQRGNRAVPNRRKLHPGEIVLLLLLREKSQNRKVGNCKLFVNAERAVSSCPSRIPNLIKNCSPTGAGYTLWTRKLPLPHLQLPAAPEGLARGARLPPQHIRAWAIGRIRGRPPAEGRAPAEEPAEPGEAERPRPETTGSSLDETKAGLEAPEAMGERREETASAGEVGAGTGVVADARGWTPGPSGRRRGKGRVVDAGAGVAAGGGEFASGGVHWLLRNPSDSI